MHKEAYTKGYMLKEALPLIPVALGAAALGDMLRGEKSWIRRAGKNTIKGVAKVTGAQDALNEMTGAAVKANVGKTFGGLGDIMKGTSMRPIAVPAAMLLTMLAYRMMSGKKDLGIGDYILPAAIGAGLGYAGSSKLAKDKVIDPVQKWVADTFPKTPAMPKNPLEIPSPLKG
jgi:hypothetical protein